MSKFNKEALQEAVNNSISFAGVQRYLGFKQGGCNFKIIPFEL